jgi:uncharacterized protein (DUF488 family)
VARILTIGHSNHTAEKLVELLRQHDVEVVVDTRSHPYSKYAHQHDHEALKQSLTSTGIRYVYMGNEVGGRPRGDEFYDAGGHVLYDKVAESAIFLEGISRLEKGMDDFCIALLCSEENPAECHRRLLIGRVLRERGAVVEHIRGDGRLQSDEEVGEQAGEVQDQLSLFAAEEKEDWKSIPSVSRKRRQSSSSVS